MFNRPTNYYITSDGNLENMMMEFDKIINYLGTLEEIKIDISDDEAIITYKNSPLQSTLTNKTRKKYSDTTVPSSITFTCEKNDSESVKYINNAIKNYGYRIFNPATSSYIVNDDNLTDLSMVELEPELTRVFTKYDLTPLYKYENSLVYYALNNKDSSIHLVNRHLLEHLLNSKKDLKKQKKFSSKVADNLSTFIALFDRGLIAIAFYPYSFKTTKIINLSGFDETAIEEDVVITPVFFEMATSKQAFQSMVKIPYLGESTIKKGSSVKSHIDQMTKNPFFKGKVLCVKVASDVSYEDLKNGKVIPRLTMSIFLDEQKN